MGCGASNYGELNIKVYILNQNLKTRVSLCEILGVGPGVYIVESTGMVF